MGEREQHMWPLGRETITAEGELAVQRRRKTQLEMRAEVVHKRSGCRGNNAL